MSLADRVLTDSDDRLVPPTNPFLGSDWIEGYIRDLSEGKAKKGKKPPLEPAEPDPKDVEPEGKPEAKGEGPDDGKDIPKEIEDGAKLKDKKSAEREKKAKAPAEKKEAPPAGDGADDGGPPPPSDAQDEPDGPTEPAPEAEPEQDEAPEPQDEPQDEPEDEGGEGDDQPQGATDAAGASATEPVGAARSKDDAERDHATAIGQADQHARAEQGSRATADKHRQSVEDFANEYEDAGGQVSQVGGQRHLHPPTADDSPEIHDIYQQFDDALWQRDEHELKAIESHRKKREARGEARRHDYEVQNGEKWTEKEDPPGFGHQHVEPKGKDKKSKSKSKDKKPKDKKPKDKKSKTESLDEALDSLNLVF